MARAFLAEERRKAAAVLLGVDRDDFDELVEDVVDLPTMDVALQVDLPRLLTPELERLRLAIDEEDEESFEAVVDAAIDQLDAPERRAALARGALSLRDAGRIDPQLAAMAIIDLWTRRSALFHASVVQALAVAVGAARTPAGLLVVSQ
jgi:glycine/D-amino acid oxidase-like deaminating enzyme